MKFVVIHRPLDVVEVKLAYESEKKIKKILAWTAIAAGSLAVGYALKEHHIEIVND